MQRAAIERAPAVVVAAPATPALFRRHPALAARLPRVALGTFPTPVEHARALGAELGMAQLWLKRDDLSHADYGGGKVRKLELLLAEARARGAHTVVTSGGVGSNHAYATALFARRLGLGVVLLLAPQPHTPEVRAHLLASHALGADIRLVGSQGAADSEARRLAAADPGVFVIAAGGSSTTGDIGFVNAGFELAEQVAAGTLPEPRRIYVPMGTMGMAAGLAVGLRAAGLGSELVAVRASSPGTSSQAALLAKMRALATHLHALDATFPAVTLGPGEVQVVADELGPGYARPTAAGQRAAALFREHAGLTLELTYGAKAFAAVIARETRANEVVLFWISSSAHEPEPPAVDLATFPRALLPLVKAPLAQPASE